MTNKEKAKINNDLVGKALDDLEDCRFKRGGKLDKIHDELNSVYDSKIIDKETDYKAHFVIFH